MGWLTGYKYRKSHTITGTTDGAQTDYQMRLSVHYAVSTDSQDVVYVNQHCDGDDFDDIRFTKGDGETELDFWIEEFTASTNATYWVEINSIPVSPNTTTVYMYYKHAVPASGSDGDNTFLFYDHFTGAALDGAKWSTIQGAFSVASSELIMTGGDGIRGLIESRGDNNYAWSTGAFHSYAKGLVNSLQNHHWCSFRESGNWNNRVDLFGNVDADAVNLVTYDAGVNTSTWSATADLAAYYEYKTYFDTTTYFYQDDIQLAAHSTNIPGTSCEIVFYEGNNNGEDMLIDWCFLRNYANPAPAHGAWGNEERPLWIIATAHAAI